MKKDLNIVMNGKTLMLDPKQTIEVNEDFPKEIRSGYVEICKDLRMAL